jgi:hypothetical protein
VTVCDSPSERTFVGSAPEVPWQSNQLEASVRTHRAILVVRLSKRDVAAEELRGWV